MLRSLVGSEDIDELKALAEAFEPVPFYDRYLQQHTSQLTPLTSFVDAVRPDPPLKHALQLAADAAVKDPHGRTEAGKDARAELQTYFEGIAAAVPEAMPVLGAHPHLAGMQPVAARVPVLAGLGLTALKLLGGEVPPDPAFKARALSLIDGEAKKTGESVRFVFIGALRTLVNATS